MNKTRAKILVMGLGNILLRDGGIGVRVIEYLQRLPIPQDTEFVDAAKPDIDLFKMITGRSTVIVVDAVDSNAPPGTLLKSTHDDWRPALRNSLSLIELDIAQTPAMLGTLGASPARIIYLGIVPEIIEPGLTLSQTLASLVPAIAQYVLEEISSLCSQNSSTVKH